MAQGILYATTFLEVSSSERSFEPILASDCVQSPEIEASGPQGRETPVPLIWFGEVPRFGEVGVITPGKRAWRPVPGWRPVRPYSSHEPDFQVPYPAPLPRSPFGDRVWHKSEFSSKWLNKR